MEKILSLDVEAILPGHGPLGTKEAVSKQMRYMERVHEVRSKWDPADGWESAPKGIREEIEGILSEYPLHGRSREYMRDRVIQSIAVSGAPQF